MLEKIHKRELLDYLHRDIVLQKFQILSTTIPDAVLSSKSLKEIHLDHVLFKNCDFTKATIENIRVENCRFENCDFSNARFSDSSLISCQMVDCSFKNTEILQCRLDFLLLDKCNGDSFSIKNTSGRMTAWTGCRFEKMAASAAAFPFSDFTETRLSNSSFQNCDLSGSTFKEAELEAVHFQGSNLILASLEKAKVKNVTVDRSNCLGLSVVGIDLAQLDHKTAIWQDIRK